MGTCRRPGNAAALRCAANGGPHAAACAHAADRGLASGGLIIVVSGVLLAAFWTGFLRVGSQLSLFLAPLFALLLILRWMGVPIG